MEPSFELSDLAPEPREEWRRLLRFVGWNHVDDAAASRSVETLFRRGPELVVQTYDYLRQVPETAAILGWEQSVDESHLEERRRFFTVWLARTLGMDTSDEFADYLFRAGKYHAGHGPRRIHTPPEYVIGSMGLVQAAFARYMLEAGLAADVIAGATAAWNKYLAAQLNQMLLGYRVARDLSRGSRPVRCSVFGRLRPLVGAREIEVRAEDGASVTEILRKFFNNFPQARAEALDRVWHSHEKADALWTEVAPVYVPRSGWRVLLNGRDLNYAGGFGLPVHEGDEVALFPPGR
ncbi:MAG: protoglobin domain-containing protein [Chloroflexota bacterium]|nr:protoglobin domain-containing protein [Anaerolineales bacterium]